MKIFFTICCFALCKLVSSQVPQSFHMLKYLPPVNILLNYDDGRKKQLLIYIFEEDMKRSSPKLIVIAGQSFTLAQ